jgi:hypothetical protein
MAFHVRHAEGYQVGAWPRFAPPPTAIVPR